MPLPSPTHRLKQSRLIFFHGKGGVGKTRLSRALALALGSGIWCTIEDPDLPTEKPQAWKPGLTTQNLDPALCFEEYVGLKLRLPALSRVFLRNRMIQYMARAAPGIRDLVLLGKIWFDSKKSTRVIGDLPSSGYSLTMFHATRQFRDLFGSSLLAKDAQSMLEMFGDPAQTCHVIVTLAEEMPIQETLELQAQLAALFPQNPALIVANRLLPPTPVAAEIPSQWRGDQATSPEDTPIAASLLAYLALKGQTQQELWAPTRAAQADAPFEFPWLPPQNVEMLERALAELWTQYLKESRQ